MSLRIPSLIFSIEFAVIAGCASNWDPLHTDVEKSDLPDQGSVRVEYTNRTDGNVCLLTGSWPTRDGAIDSADGRVFLIVDDERFSMIPFNTGYCPGCRLVVKPGETVTSLIPYSYFDLPDELYGASKQLKMPITAYTCPREE